MRARRVCVPVNGPANISCLLKLEIQQSYNFILLHVQPTSCVSTGPAYIPSDKVFELFELQTKRTTQRILKRVLNICDRYYVKAETHVVIGKANERICQAAAELGAHFLVVGSHGHGTFIRATRGSVSDYCARNAMCPVVVVNKKVFFKDLVSDGFFYGGRNDSDRLAYIWFSVSLKD